MIERDLESLLLDFRERGDVAALAAIFDRTSNELLKLALHLLPEPSQAEDVVQATFLSAIQNVESFERGKRVMPWLVGILANHAAQVRRERAQSVDPTRFDARSELDPSAEIERHEVAQILARAVAELPEPYRDVVQRHVIEGERAVDIARQQGVAAGTVRMRILRGLEQLRRVLPAGLFAGGAGAWPVRGSNIVREHVLAAARAKSLTITATAGSGAALGATMAASIGGTLVSLKILFGAVALAAALLVTWRLAAPSAAEPSSTDLVSESPRNPMGPATSDADASASVLATDLASATRAPSSSSAVPDAAPTHGWWLVGNVTGLDGKPAAATKITVGLIPGPSVPGSVDESGRFAIDVHELFTEKDPPAELFVSVDHPANRRGDALVAVSKDQCERGKSERLEIATDVKLEPFAIVTGRVEPAAGGGRGDVRIELVPAPVEPVESDRHESLPALNPRASEGGGTSIVAGSAGLLYTGRANTLGEPSPHGIADPRTGRFELRSKAGGRMSVRAACDGFLASSRTIDVPLGETTDAGLVRLSTGDVSIEGQISFPFQFEDYKLRVIARRSDTEELEPGWNSPGELYEGRAQETSVDAHRRFLITGLTQGAWRLALFSGEQHLQVVQPVATTCAAPSSGVTLGANLGRLVVVAQSAAGPLANVRVLLTWGEPYKHAQLTTDEQGRATFLVDSQLDLVVEARPNDGTTVTLSLPAKGRALDSVQVLEIKKSASASLVLDHVGSGRAPEHLLLRLRSDQSKARPQSRAKLVDGRYTISGLEPGRWTVDVSPVSSTWFGMAGGEFLCEESFNVELAPGEKHERPIAFREAGRVRFELEGWGNTDVSNAAARAHVVDAQGMAMRSTFVVRVYSQGALHVTSAEGAIPLNDASELAEGLAPGSYQIVFDDSVWTSEPVSFTAIAGESRAVHVHVRKR